MRFTQTLVAAAALAAAGSAMAVTPAARIAISSGASASKGNLKLALTNRCSGQLAEFASGNNISTYVCAPAGSFANPNSPTAAEYNAAGATNFTSTAIAELRLNVAGGSFTAMCLLAGWPSANAGCATPDTYVEPSTGALAAPPSGSVVVGGLMDVEPTAFSSTVRAGVPTAGVSIISANFGQTFGVAVSPTLYADLFNYQKSTLGVLPSDCDVTLTNRPECVPSIGKAQVASILTLNDSSPFYTIGAAFLTGGNVSTTPVPITYARRVNTSGTQASAQQYFLGNICLAGGQDYTVVPENHSVGPVTVTALSSTGDVRTLLNSASARVIGIISGENNQTGQSWRWLRVGGMPIAENAAPGTAGQTNTKTALPGLYDYWFLSRVARPNGAVPTNFWNAVITGLGTVPAGTTAGLFRTSETIYGRGTANSCKPVASSAF